MFPFLFPFVLCLSFGFAFRFIFCFVFYFDFPSCFLLSIIQLFCTLIRIAPIEAVEKRKQVIPLFKIISFLLFLRFNIPQSSYMQKRAKIIKKVILSIGMLLWINQIKKRPKQLKKVKEIPSTPFA